MHFVLELKQTSFGTEMLVEANPAVLVLQCRTAGL